MTLYFGHELEPVDPTDIVSTYDSYEPAAAHGQHTDALYFDAHELVSQDQLNEVYHLVDAMRDAATLHLGHEPKPTHPQDTTLAYDVYDSAAAHGQHTDAQYEATLKPMSLCLSNKLILKLVLLGAIMLHMRPMLACMQLVLRRLQLSNILAYILAPIIGQLVVHAMQGLQESSL